MRTIGDVIHACKHLADLCIEWGEDSKAIEYMNQAVDFAKTTEIKHDYPESLFYLSKYLFKAGKIKEAISQAEKAKQLFKELSDKNCSLQVSEKIGEWRNGGKAAEFKATGIEIYHGNLPEGAKEHH